MRKIYWILIALVVLIAIFLSPWMPIAKRGLPKLIYAPYSGSGTNFIIISLVNGTALNAPLIERTVSKTDFYFEIIPRDIVQGDIGEKLQPGYYHLKMSIYNESPLENCWGWCPNPEAHLLE